MELSKLDQQKINDKKSDFSGTIKISSQALNEEKKKIEISSGSNLEIVANYTKSKLYFYL